MKGCFSSRKEGLILSSSIGQVPWLEPGESLQRSLGEIAGFGPPVHLAGQAPAPTQTLCSPRITCHCCHTTKGTSFDSPGEGGPMSRTGPSRQERWEKSQVLSVYRTLVARREMKPQVFPTHPPATWEERRQPKLGDQPPVPRPVPSPAAGSRGSGGDRASSGTGQRAPWSRRVVAWRPGGSVSPRPCGGSFLARKGAIVCSYSWYVRPQAEGAPPPERARDREGG